jgi:ElaB/YqjD/DUF883 family membrane-anchored ribosome-binding protein
MPKVGEILKERAKKTTKGKVKMGSPSQAEAKVGSRRMRFEVTINEKDESVQKSQHDSQDFSKEQQEVIDSTTSDSSSKGKGIQDSVMGALKVIQQGLGVGKAFAEQRFPKTKKVVDAVVADWSSGGSFAEIPVSNPFIRKALQNGLVQARDWQIKVMTHPQTEKLAMHLFKAGLKAQAMVEQLRAKVVGKAQQNKNLDENL